MDCCMALRQGIVALASSGIRCRAWQVGQDRVARQLLDGRAQEQRHEEDNQETTPARRRDGANLRGGATRRGPSTCEGGPCRDGRRDGVRTSTEQPLSRLLQLYPLLVD